MAVDQWQPGSSAELSLFGCPGELRAQLERFLFDVDEWVSLPALARELKLSSAIDWAPLMTRSAVRKTVAAQFPSRRLSPALLTGELRGRLALLPRAEWLRLGLALALLPYCGGIRHSMDGHFRRAVRQAFDDATINALDQHDTVEERPVFIGGPGAWRNPQVVALGGVWSAVEQACGWPDVVKNRFYLQFEPNERSAPPSVNGVNGFWLEVACKTIFPNPHWLWS